MPTLVTKLLIATSNKGKLREVRAMLEALGVEVIGLTDIDAIEEPVEDGDTFDANARKKAIHYAAASGLWALADDSGLEVDVLNGAPGVYSARYAGEDADDMANNARLIRELQVIPEANRTARFRCAMALATSDKVVVATSSGTIEGVIIDEPRGHNGFGYDPHFFIPDQDRTAAELPPVQKNRISHRGQALAAIHPQIVRLLVN
jgi:XTP/dITP diphosphohydrolase